LKDDTNLKNDDIANRNSCLEELYSKIMNGQMEDPNKAVAEI
jgi:hypothetical protein